jgi:hypothetical protein
MFLLTHFHANSGAAWGVIGGPPVFLFSPAILPIAGGISGRARGETDGSTPFSARRIHLRRT